MNKKRIVLAAALSMALTPAFAGGASSNVQLYGIIDAGIEHLSFDNTSVNRLGSGIQVPDLIGVKGNEDLGGGLSAFFQAETGFCGNGNGTFLRGNNVYSGANQGAQYQANSDYCTGGQFMGRETMVGLSGDFGKLSLGRLATPSFINALVADPFGAGLTGGMFNLDPAFPIYVYVSQAMQYQTPTMSGLQGTLLYALGGQSSGASNGQFYNASLNYRNGPVMAGIAYLHHNFTSGGPIPDAALMLDATTRSIVPSSDGYFTNKVLQLFGGYNLGVANITAYYADEKFGDGGTMSDGSQTPHFKVWWIGATIPAGPGSILASIGQHKDSNLINSTARQYAVGYNYPMSKQTNLYASYAHISNGSNVDQYVGDTTVVGTGMQGGQSSSGIALGIRHAF